MKTLQLVVLTIVCLAILIPLLISMLRDFKELAILIIQYGCDWRFIKVLIWSCILVISVLVGYTFYHGIISLFK